MELLQLKYFCHAASTQNFSQTAREFLVPVSSISHCIKRLEADLGVALFIRSSNRLQLSPQGELFYKSVKNALDTLDSAMFAVKSSISKESVHLAICMHRQSIIPAINLFQAKFPNIQITHERPPMPATGFSREGYDIIIADDAIDDPAFEKEQLSHGKCMLITPKDFFQKQTITPDLLSQQTFISLPLGSYMYRNTQRLFQTLNISPQILTEKQYSVHFVPRFIEERQGVAFSPQTTRWVESMSEFIDTYDIGNIYHDAYIYRRKTATSPYVIGLYDLIRDKYKKK